MNSLPYLLRFSGLAVFFIFTAQLAVNIPEIGSVSESVGKILWFVLEGETGTLPALTKDKVLIQRLPHMRVEEIDGLEILLSTVGDIRGVTYHLKLFNSRNVEIFSTTIYGEAVVANAYNRVPVGRLGTPLRNERMYLALFSENATDGGALTAYFTSNHPKGTFFIAPYNHHRPVTEVFKTLDTDPRNQKFRGSLNLNIIGK